MKLWFGLLVLLVAGTAAAEPVHPYAIRIGAGAQFAADTGYPETNLALSRRWWDRLHAGVRVTTGLNSTTFVAREMAELGVWIAPSRRLEVLLAWRAGHSVHRLNLPSGMEVWVNAVVIEPVIELSFRIGRATELRVSPITASAHRSGMWLFVLGAEAAVAWRM